MNKAAAVFIALLWMPVLAPRSYGADAKAELQALVDKVKAKIHDGKESPADFADDFKSFDALLAEHQGEKTDDVAGIRLLKAALYGEVLHDDVTATVELKKVEADYPGTESAQQAEKLIAAFARQHAADEIQSHLVAGAPFPDFHETDLSGQPLSPANYHGKIVLIDFWATWCGPCVQELPNVLKVYQQYHDKGFEVIGVSLDEEKDKLTDFIKEKGVAWPQYFDGKGWQNKLAATYGITGVPATYLLGKDGKIIGKDLRGDSLESAVSTALAAK